MNSQKQVTADRALQALIESVVEYGQDHTDTEIADRFNVTEEEASWLREKGAEQYKDAVDKWENELISLETSYKARTKDERRIKAAKKRMEELGYIIDKCGDKYEVLKRAGHTNAVEKLKIRTKYIWGKATKEYEFLRTFYGIDLIWIDTHS